MVRTLALAAVLTTAALTACGNQDPPAADPAPTTSTPRRYPRLRR
ncbi:MAG: hypothetical protein U5N53_08505 [Mycobacterium sp.]|nr:hypothetical protein [Mycobacterium sp.]